VLSGRGTFVTSKHEKLSYFGNVLAYLHLYVVGTLNILLYCAYRILYWSYLSTFTHHQKPADSACNCNLEIWSNAYSGQHGNILATSVRPQLSLVLLTVPNCELWKPCLHFATEFILTRGYTIRLYLDRSFALTVREQNNNQNTHSTTGGKDMYLLLFYALFIYAFRNSIPTTYDIHYS
jgi:hypothetical protein